jgi:putative iron-only hydrogenase system regulator
MEGFMETRVALIGIIVENYDSVEKLNQLLHQYAEYVVGRMGVPYTKKGISIISIAIDAPADVISSLSGKLGMLPGVNTKTIYSKAAADKDKEAEK